MYKINLAAVPLSMVFLESLESGMFPNKNTQLPSCFTHLHPPSNCRHGVHNRVATRALGDLLPTGIHHLVRINLTPVMAKPRITSQSVPSLVFPNMYVYICIKWTDLQSAASFTGGYLADGFSTFELCGPRAYLPTSLAPIALMTLQGEMPARTLEGNVQCGFFPNKTTLG